MLDTLRTLLYYTVLLTGIISLGLTLLSGSILAIGAYVVRKQQRRRDFFDG